MKDEFIKIYKENITREGADEFLEYLMSPKSDFFTAPASTKYHGSHEGGLVEHSVNVYYSLKNYLERSRVTDDYKINGYTNESIAIAALLHDVCKVNIYKPGTRNVKVDGAWQTVPTYEFCDELPYGHGEKSVYILSGFMRLSRDEAFAIRYHMGFSNAENINNVSRSFEKYPLAFALYVADMEATYFLEKK